MAKAKKGKFISEEAKLVAEQAVIAVSRQVKFNVAEYPVSMYVSRFKDDVNDGLLPVFRTPG